MPPPQPLGRSLVPLAGESLPGFLLRLSFRLNLAPAELAAVTGLTAAGDAGSLHAATLTAVPEAARRDFTRMTRLTDSQVTGLGLAAWQERYPLPAWAPRAGRRLPADAWSLFAPATRFCPECLAGDGSPVQESFGGPWLKTWHLPVVFACPAHRRLLEHRCPECGQDIHAGRASNALLPAMRLAGLHPAQCRTEVTTSRGRTLPACCGARLDQASHRRTASPELMALQGKILGLLDPGGPASTLCAGLPAPPSGYLTDIRALGHLACSTWPAARHLAPSEEAAIAIDQHVSSLRRRSGDQHDAAPASASRVRFDLPPADAAVSGCLAHIADRILNGSAEEAREQLRTILPPSTRRASRTAWGVRVTRSSPPCSEGLQAAYAPLLRAFARADGQPQGRRSAVLHGQRWGPENIPAFLPEDWYARRFTPIAGINPLFVRRTAVLRLVQMVAGGSLGEAAAFLEIASADTTWAGKGRIYSGAGYVHTGARQQPDPRGFEASLSAIARELDSPATPLVNYQRRRQALQAWCIDEETWTRLARRLPRVPGPEPELRDRKRQIASVYVWVQVTSGEHYFAPRPIEAAQPPEVQEAWRARWATIWHLMHRNRTGPHYASLKAELDILATSLARSIDTRHG